MEGDRIEIIYIYNYAGQKGLQLSERNAANKQIRVLLAHPRQVGYQADGGLGVLQTDIPGTQIKKRRWRV